MLEIIYGLLDITAADDAKSSATDLQAFANAQAINTPDLDRLYPKKYATLEKNLWLLDGTCEQWPLNPSNETWGLWSKQMSGPAGVFETPIVLTIAFTENHSSEGLTLFFRPDTYDYSTDFTVEYYNGSGSLLLKRDFTAGEATFFAESPVEDYQKIVITFRSTSLPHRYLKLTEIKYGSLKIFDEDSIISASILEEIDPTGAELSFNTMECTVHTSDFQLLDPQGIYKMLQQKQAINVSSIDPDGGGRSYGTFFLEEPNSEDDDTTTLSCIDFLGVIDKTEFLGGIYENKNAGELLDEIMLSAEVNSNEYECEASLRSKTITGWIPICSHREALRHWAFSIGAIVECSRGKKIRAYSVPTQVSGTISHDDKIIGHKVSLKALVTGATVTAHKYTVGTESSVAYEGILQAGENLVTFGNPYSGLTVTGGTLVESGANYAVVNMAAAGTAKVTGKPYVDSKSVYSVFAPNLPANAKPNVLTVDAPLINPDNAQEIAQRIYDYSQNRYQDEGEIILGEQKTGEIWSMNSLNERNIQGYIKRLEIDLVTELANISMIGKSVAR